MRGTLLSLPVGLVRSLVAVLMASSAYYPRGALAGWGSGVLHEVRVPMQHAHPLASASPPLWSRRPRRIDAPEQALTRTIGEPTQEVDGVSDVRVCRRDPGLDHAGENRSVSPSRSADTSSQTSEIYVCNVYHNSMRQLVDSSFRRKSLRHCQAACLILEGVS